MAAVCYNPDGSPNCGDPEISDPMRAECGRVGGFVVDTDTGDVIYGVRS